MPSVDDMDSETHTGSQKEPSIEIPERENETTEPESDDMQLREHEGVKGKRDAYPFDPRQLKIIPGYNIRDLDSPDERPELDELKASIKEKLLINLATVQY